LVFATFEIREYSARRQHTPKELLDLCFTLLDHANHAVLLLSVRHDSNAEHWRLSIQEAQQLQHDIMGYLPGSPATHCLRRAVVGKRWVHQLREYDREKGISYWTKNYKTASKPTIRRAHASL